MKHYIHAITSLFAFFNNTQSKKEPIKPETVIYELHEYRDFIASIDRLHIVKSLVNASRNQQDVSFYKIEKWAATAIHYNSVFIDKLLIEQYDEISKTRRSITIRQKH